MCIVSHHLPVSLLLGISVKIMSCVRVMKIACVWQLLLNAAPSSTHPTGVRSCALTAVHGISCSSRRCACNPYLLTVLSGSHRAADGPLAVFGNGAVFKCWRTAMQMLATCWRSTWSYSFVSEIHTLLNGKEHSAMFSLYFKQV